MLVHIYKTDSPLALSMFNFNILQGLYSLESMPELIAPYLCFIRAREGGGANELHR